MPYYKEAVGFLLAATSLVACNDSRGKENQNPTDIPLNPIPSATRQIETPTQTINTPVLATCEPSPATDFQLPFTADSSGIHVDVDTIYVDGDPCYTNQTLDQSCGIQLIENQKGVWIDFLIVDQNKDGFSVGFELKLERKLDNNLYFAGLPVFAQHYMAFSVPGSIVPIGMILVLSNSSAFFAPYLERSFSVEGCDFKSTQSST